MQNKRTCVLPNYLLILPLLKHKEIEIFWEKKKSVKDVS